ncbi:hypothetical protein Q8A67_005312 [Cirrhinus molitorella]|uniref:Uncharacterized protein n=1 Tax=Cirrhinus molitorella TaxID=172907 RepID=A0AA88Q6T3_9TELE|nr:hypothetical protein Q8A67_005312 [Cirrhinus molitorella]
MSLSEENEDQDIACNISSPSPETSSNQSMKNRPSDFSDVTETSDTRRKTQRSEPLEPSSVSVKSNTSMMQPNSFRDVTVKYDPIFVAPSASHNQTHIMQNKTEADLQRHTLFRTWRPFQNHTRIEKICL